MTFIFCVVHGNRNTLLHKYGLEIHQALDTSSRIYSAAPHYSGLCCMLGTSVTVPCTQHTVRYHARAHCHEKAGTHSSSKWHSTSLSCWMGHWCSLPFVVSHGDSLEQLGFIRTATDFGRRQWAHCRMAGDDSKCGTRSLVFLLPFFCVFMEKRHGHNPASCCVDTTEINCYCCLVSLPALCSVTASFLPVCPAIAVNLWRAG